MRYVVLVLLVMGCSGGVTSGVDAVDAEAADALVDRVGHEVHLRVPDSLGKDGSDAIDWPEDSGPDVTELGCLPGEGCFLDKCTENSQCQSGWCVEHLGEGVCSVVCQEECPAGWSCQLVAGSLPDAVFICVSDATNLCRPCNSAADCKTGYGAEDVCVSYGPGGAFCGAPCTDDGSCPWGFSCVDTETVDGLATRQCVADAGTCPCTEKSVSLSLFTDCEVANEWGSCVGKRVCIDEGLTDCDAAEPADETCNGLDDDCDGETDEAKQTDDGYLNLCDDENPCTKDVCNGEDGCDHVALTEGECADGDPCTVADHCEAGVCVGQAVDCDDDNPCTEDLCTATGGCEHPPAAGECDDGDPCTLGDHCQSGTCLGAAVNCQCQTTADCGALEDGNLCNGTLVCNTDAVPYVCDVDPATVVDCPEAEGADAPCQVAACSPETGACGWEAANDGAPCDDGDACTVGDTCAGGVCLAGAGANCNDGDVCTDDSCDAQAGCAHTNNTVPCSDGLDCTVADACADGVCVGGPAANCNDGNVCTDDSCQEGLGCVHEANEVVCEDGNACTTGDACVQGACKPGGLVNCNDDNPCTDDGCDLALGCVHQANTAPCTDGNACTLNDQCQGGICAPGPVQNCDDANPCTDDACGAGGLCTHVANQEDCDDGNACTVGDSCSGGQCVPAEALSCDDDNVCTTDSCDLATGCVYTLNSVACDDGDVCTIGDHCEFGDCVAGATLSCDDGNACTDDACGDAGCVNTPNSDPCDDGNACTTGDSCGDGKCVGGAALTCDDENECTDDTCDIAAGCQFEANTVGCDDDDACTTADVCSDGSCVGGPAAECDDGNDCTVDGCDAQTGCTFANEENQTACGDGLTGECLEGECVYPNVDYPNGNAAYWTERKLGFRDVTIQGGNLTYSYNAQLKQYRSGDTILVPTKQGGQNGFTVSATSFYGMSGSSPNDANFQWDGATAIAQPNVFDVPNMFVSPVLQSEMSYCQIMQYNNVSGCNAVVVDGPTETLAYPNQSPKSGTFNVESGTDLIAVNNLKGNGSTQYISQQQLGAGPNQSYCVATYGAGWRMATDVEMGHTTDEMDQKAQPAYVGNSTYRIRSSTAWPGLNDQRWCPYSQTGDFNQCNVAASGSRRVRCVFPGE